MSEDFVVKVTGTLASTPYGLYDAPKVADATGSEARYVSFHAVDFRPPIPSYSALYDGDLWAHYGKGEARCMA